MSLWSVVSLRPHLYENEAEKLTEIVQVLKRKYAKEWNLMYGLISNTSYRNVFI